MQLVLKKKYAAEGYQHVPASGGDFGIEGFTRETGHAFQCYCPDFHYERKELYAHQRKKITDDLNSLRNYATGLQSILGDTRIKNWYLITPDVINKDLIVHAVKKQNEVRDWGLPHLHEEFTVYVHDAGYYMNEINDVRQIEGAPITLARETPKIPELNDEKTDYEGNLERKTKLRAGDKGDAAFEGLLKLTRRAFLDHDPYFHQLYNSHPHTYWQVARTLHGLEERVEEMSYELTGDPDNLVSTVRTSLTQHLKEDKLLNIDATMADNIVRRTVARWLAVCQMDFR
ncbi:hypothetical protein [Pseudomonas mediterranea]|uniref:hypothetical protein n=1 Tax=Pseudomonas mediterranea TaxID=183795 RepID=UPI0006D8B112|nr:hypothetical protein [Pseudomonas mediterranea]